MAGKKVLSKKDLDNILSSIYLISIVVVSAFFFALIKYINPLWVAVIWFAAQQLYVLPRVHKLYMKLHDLPSNPLTRYVPLANEVSMFTPVYSMINLVTGVVNILLFVIALAPVVGINFFTPMIESIFGQDAADSYTFYLMLFGFILYFVMSFVRGMAFVQMNREVNRLHAKYYGATRARVNLGSAFESLRYLMFLVPFGRTISLQFMGDRMYKMVELNELRDLEEEELVVQTRGGVSV